MKPTVRVSIGGIAFNLEEDAYQLLNNYLLALKRHFSGNPESTEIIADIEMRLSELLQVRLNGRDMPVAINDAQEIIQIMGNPKDFDQEETNQSAEDNNSGINDENKEGASRNSFKKRLFKDGDNKIIGGVCSGIGHYFKIDPTVIRFILVVGLLLTISSSFRAATPLILLYLIFWVIMPTARTFNQKLSMTGSNPSIENIEDRTQPVQRKYKGSIFSSVLKVLINIFAGVFTALIVIVMVVTIAVFIWFYTDTELFGLTNYLVLAGYNSLNLKIALMLALLIPMGGLLSLFIKALSRSPFTTQTMVSFLIGFVVWICAVGYITNKGVKFAHTHKTNEEVVEILPISINADTLFVRLGEDYMNVQEQPQNPMMFYRGENIGDREVCILPQVKVRQDTSITTYKIEVHKKDFGDNTITARRRAEALKLDYIVKDSVFVINPKWYSQKDKWNQETFEIVIEAPQNKTVVIESPLREFYHITPLRFSHHDYPYYSDFDFDFDFD